MGKDEAESCPITFSGSGKARADGTREKGRLTTGRVPATHPNGQIIGIKMIATSHIKRFKGIPTRMKSVKR